MNKKKPAVSIFAIFELNKHTMEPEINKCLKLHNRGKIAEISDNLPQEKMKMSFDRMIDYIIDSDNTDDHDFYLKEKEKVKFVFIAEYI